VTIGNAIALVPLNGIGVKLKSKPKFIDIFEHFYDDSIYKDISKHYVNIAYEYGMKEITDYL